MALTQGRSKRKETGGRYTNTNPKRVSQTANAPTLTELGDRKVKTRRTRGGHTKQILLQDNTINLYLRDKEKHVEAEITNVLENDANANYVRRNIITRGCIVDTNEGKAKVTNRPAQDGIIQGVSHE